MMGIEQIANAVAANKKQGAQHAHAAFYQQETNTSAPNSFDNKAMLDSLSTVNTDEGDFAAFMQTVTAGEVQVARKAVPMQSLAGYARIGHKFVKRTVDADEELAAGISWMSADILPIRVYFKVHLEGTDSDLDLIAPCLVQGENAPTARALWKQVKNQHKDTILNSKRAVRAPAYFKLTIETKQSGLVTSKGQAGVWETIVYTRDNQNEVDTKYDEFLDECHRVGKLVRGKIIAELKEKKNARELMAKQAKFRADGTERVIEEPANAEMEAPVYARVVVKFD